MSPSKVRYLVGKSQKGHMLYYWQPSASLMRAGFKTASLGKDRDAAIKQAEALNAMVDKWRGGMSVLATNRQGTIPWIIEQYKKSPKWARIRDTSKVAYGTWFSHILRWSADRGDPPLNTITKRDAEDLWRSINGHSAYQARHAVARCSMPWNYAMDLDEDLVSRNPFRNFGLPKPTPRSQVWQPAQIAAVIETALTPGPWGSLPGPNCPSRQFARPSMALAVLIAINTAQRPSDIRALRWSQYDGKQIALTQIKTDAKVTVPVTEQLKVALDDAWRSRSEGKVVQMSSDGPIVAEERSGRAWSRVKFIPTFRRIARAAGVPDDLQFRDLRRTATTHLAEAGCTLHEIASIGGWTVDTVAKMMETYAKVNVTMANNAIVKLEQYRKRPLEG
jgi:integrase